MDDTIPIAKMHELLLEALRSRELEIFRYLTILGPALAGFGWLLYQDNALESRQTNVGPGFFMAVTVGVLLLLLLGAWYSLTLGYNYRYITLQLAKLESRLDIRSAMLKGWPKCPQAFLERYMVSDRPWCTPPAVIKVFWYAFLVAIIGVTLTAAIWRHDKSIIGVVPVCSVYVVVGTISFLVALLLPFHFGRKLASMAEAEKKAVKDGDWRPRRSRSVGTAARPRQRTIRPRS